MTVRDLVLANRSYRRFQEKHAITRQTLTELVDLARLSASSANRQPLKFWLACDPAQNARIFPLLTWAGYLTDWAGPAAGKRPSAYVVLLADTGISRSCTYDAGIAAQSILLGAVERGLGGCIIGSVQREALRAELDLAPPLEILLVLALGQPIESVVVEKLGPEGDIRYWRDETGTHHVPKRSLDEIILP